MHRSRTEKNLRRTIQMAVKAACCNEGSACPEHKNEKKKIRQKVESPVSLICPDFNWRLIF